MRLSRLFFVSIFLLLFAAAAEPWSGRYALILSDQPLALREPAETQNGRTARRTQLQSAHAVLRTALVNSNFLVTGEVQNVLNAVFVKAAPDQVTQLRSMPGVVAVIPLQRYRLFLNKAVPLMNGPAAWQTLGGESNAGRGIKIGIIDTGIDQNHAAFQDSSISPPNGYPICSGGDCAFTNNKVIVARSYIQMEAAGTPATSRPDDYTPRDRVGHGTAVAMTAAGNTNTGPSATISGMAPHAFVGNYKVFGTSAFASGDAIIQAIDDAQGDGMDIASLSLGSTAFYAPGDTSCGGVCDVLAQAVQNAVQGGMIVVVAAGNLGMTGFDATGTAVETLSTASSPGDAPLAITAGATTNGHSWVTSIHLGGSNPPSNLTDIVAQFGNGPLPKGTLTAPVRDVQPLSGDPQACSTIPANSLTGAFALIQRGNCTFVTKVENAEAAGAAGVVLYDNTVEQLITPGGLSNTYIPALIVSQSDGQALKAYVDANNDPPLTFDPTPHESVSTAALQVATFSSRGPVVGSAQIKPDIAAVGQQMYMATQSLDQQGDLYSANGYTVADGTSFATPLVSGAAALVKQKNPGWTPAQVKSAIVNNASQSVLGTSGAAATVLEVGAGLLDARGAVGATITANPASISFGVVNSARFPAAQSIQVTNVSTATEALSFTVSQRTPDSSAHVTVSPASLALAPGQSGTITATLSGSKPPAGEYDGAIVISNGSSAIRVPYLYLEGSGTPYAIIDLNQGAPDFEGTVNQPSSEGGLYFKVIDRYGVPVSNLPVQVTPAVSGQGRATNIYGPTDSNGIGGANSVTLGSQPGTQSFTATAGGLTLKFSGIARLQPAISANGVINGASYSSTNPIVPGSYIAIKGANLSDVTDISTSANLSPYMDKVAVSFDVPSAGLSLPGYLYYVSPVQLNVQVPWELQGQTSVQMKVIVGESLSSVVTVPVVSYSPAFFNYPLGSSSYIAALDSKFALITPSNPARHGDTIELYVNAMGPVTNQPASGLPAPPSPNLARTTSTATVTIGNQPASVTYSGLTPGITGLYQVNVVVPANAPSGVQPVVVSIGGVNSPPSNLPVQ